MINFYNYQTMDSHNRRLGYSIEIRENDIVLHKTTCSVLDDFSYRMAKIELDYKVKRNKPEAIITYAQGENPGKKALEYIYNRNRRFNPSKNIKAKRIAALRKLEEKNLSFWERLKRLFR